MVTEKEAREAKKKADEEDIKRIIVALLASGILNGFLLSHIFDGWIFFISMGVFLLFIYLILRTDIKW